MNPVLADENIPRVSVELLRAAGMDVSSVAERIPGATDPVVLAIARSDRRLLLTFDRDFGELIYRHGHQPPLGVVYLRFAPATPEEPARLFRGLLARGEITIEGRFTVVTREQIHQRPLPDSRRTTER